MVVKESPRRLTKESMALLAKVFKNKQVQKRTIWLLIFSLQAPLSYLSTQYVSVHSQIQTIALLAADKLHHALTFQIDAPAPP